MSARATIAASRTKGLDLLEGVPVTLYSRSRHHQRTVRCDVFAKYYRDGSLEIGPVCWPLPPGRRWQSIPKAKEIPDYMIVDEEELQNTVMDVYRRM